ncbi:hypothetical protein EV561_107292 [Rhizobium sp. BK376]|nr:hypothetical protein EV561_107292 [Rhizobium sp. BK376]
MAHELGKVLVLFFPSIWFGLIFLSIVHIVKGIRDRNAPILAR